MISPNMKEFPSDASFEHFNLDFIRIHSMIKTTGRSARAMMEETLKICRKFIDNFGSDFQNLFFYGSVGVGKTFLSTCIAREIMEREYSVVYFSAPQLFSTSWHRTNLKKTIQTPETWRIIYNICDL